MTQGKRIKGKEGLQEYIRNSKVDRLKDMKTVSQKVLSLPKAQKCLKLSSHHHPLRMHKLETLHSPNKSSPTVIKSHEDSDNSKIKTSSKVSFWGSPDLSSGVENLFKAMDLKDSSKSLIISMNLCSIKNMIQLFNLDLHEIGNLFSRQDLRDSVFQDSIIKVLCLGRCFKLLIKEKFGYVDEP